MCLICVFEKKSRYENLKSNYYELHTRFCSQNSRKTCVIHIWHIDVETSPGNNDDHIAEKDAALQEKENDKENTQVSTCTVCTEDTEGLLISPNNKSNAMFYQTKLNCHNLSYFNIKTKKVMNYLW